MTKKGEKLRAKLMSKGDFVVGHEAVYFPPHPAPYVTGKIVEAKPATVRFEIDGVIAAIIGLPRRSTWTFRNKAGGWYQKGSRPLKNETGLCLLQRR